LNHRASPAKKWGALFQNPESVHMDLKKRAPFFCSAARLGVLPKKLKQSFNS
jgi:hypothetical protein